MEFRYADHPWTYARVHHPVLRLHIRGIDRVSCRAGKPQLPISYWRSCPATLRWSAHDCREHQERPSRLLLDGHEWSVQRHNLPHRSAAEILICRPHGRFAGSLELTPTQYGRHREDWPHEADGT